VYRERPGFTLVLAPHPRLLGPEKSLDERKNVAVDPESVESSARQKRYPSPREVSCGLWMYVLRKRPSCAPSQGAFGG
jgi:hypothetical protein